MRYASGDPALLDPDEGEVGRKSGPRFAWEIPFLALCAVGGLVWWGARAIRDPSESIARIRNHPDRYSGQNVLLHGEVEDVFDMGASCVYYLRQGRDTIVVFTRGARPMSHTKRAVRGSVSIGYMDGQPRLSVFESSTGR